MGLPPLPMGGSLTCRCSWHIPADLLTGIVAAVVLTGDLFFAGGTRRTV
jgi:hypothetical protein